MRGGYFATSWGWGALAFLFVAALVIVGSESLRLSRYELVVLAAFGAFVVLEASSAWWSQSAPAAFREAERATLVVAGIATAMLVTRRHMRPLLAGVCGGITIGVSYGLRLVCFPSSAWFFRFHRGVSPFRAAWLLECGGDTRLYSGLSSLFGFAARARTVMGPCSRIGGASAASAGGVLHIRPRTMGGTRLGPRSSQSLFDGRRLQIISTCLLLPALCRAWLSGCRHENQT